MKLRVYGFMAVVVAVLLGISTLNEMLTFHEVEGLVVRTKEVCALTGTERDGARKRRWNTKEGPCVEVRRVQENDPEFKFAGVQVTIYATVSYRDASDDRMRTTEFKYKNGSGAPNEGDRITILVHNEDPAEVRETF